MLNKSSVQYFLNEKQSKLFEVFRKVVGLKPTLPYLEVHLADHCNLNCKGCSHFSPIAKKKLTDVNSFKKDTEQLHKLFSSIQKIVFLGGEPLLNPKINAFLKIARSRFPKAKLIIITNGLLLSEMTEDFWKTCRVCSVSIDVTVYPPLESKKSFFVDFVKKQKVRVSVHFTGSFQAFYNPKGDTDVVSSFKRCRKRWYTPMLNEGKIYACPMSATIKFFNQKFGLDLPDSDFVDIFSSDLDGWKIKELIGKPTALCSFCSLGWVDTPAFPWGYSNCSFTDWQVPCEANA